MDTLAPFVVALVLLFLALGVAFSYLAPYTAVLKRTGAHRVGKKAAGLAWRGAVSGLRYIAGRRRRRIRRPPTRTSIGRSR